MGVAAIQPSMSGGEMAPEMAGRVDLNRYGVSLRKCRNFLVRPFGGIDNRPGTEFLGEAKFNDKDFRLVDFVVSEDVAYCVELGDYYARFWYDGARVEHSETVLGLTQTNPAVVTATAHGFVDGQEVTFAGVGGMTEVNGNTYTVANATTDTFELQGVNATAFGAFTSGGTATGIVEVVTPWPEASLFRIKFTQSADVMTLTHGDYETQEIRRTAATRFQIRAFEFTDGPFQTMNANESFKVSASKVDGEVTIESTADLFTSDMVGTLIYLEMKELREVMPWVPDERNVALTSIRRSDGKYYKAVSVPSVGGMAGTPYYLTGNVRPTHDVGRAFDGPQDARTDGTNGYKVGVEWEYLHSGFGVARITAFTDARTVTAQVTRRFPEAVVGGLPTPGNTWTLSGDGVTKTFSIVGAASDSKQDYVVTIDGVPVTPDPFWIGQNNGGQTPPPGTVVTIEP